MVRRPRLVVLSIRFLPKNHIDAVWYIYKYFHDILIKSNKHIEDYWFCRALYMSHHDDKDKSMISLHAMYASAAINCGTVVDISKSKIKINYVHMREYSILQLKKFLDRARWIGELNPAIAKGFVEGLLSDKSFRYVRSQFSLALLPATEAAEWRKLWSEIQVFDDELSTRIKSMR